ncbi:AAA family ATPase [Gemmatimonas sp.]
MAIQFRPAQRTQVRIKMLVKGPTGAGKTYGALLVADGLAPGKVALLDSEHDRADYYADLVPFEKASAESHHPKDYIAAIHAAVAAGFEVLVIDSLSHCWLDVLARKDAYDKANPRTNQWTNWALFGGEWDELLRTILEAPIHIICTARAKMAHEQVEVGGKKQVVKLGLAPQLRENTEYEFAICFDVEKTTDGQHPAQVSKDNTNLLSEQGKVWNLADGAVPALIRKWMATAKPPERPTPETQRRIDDLLLELPEAQQAKARRRIIERKQRGFPEADALEVLAGLQTLVAGAKAAESRASETPAVSSPVATSTMPPVVADPAPMAPPPVANAHADASEPVDVEAENAALALAAAEAVTVTIGQEQKALRDLTTKALQKLRPMAAERENRALVQAIDTVLQARPAPPTTPAPGAPAAAPQRSAEERAAAFEQEVAQLLASLGPPDLGAASRTTITYREHGAFQLQMLNSAALRRRRTSGLIRPEQAAAIDVVLAYRAAHPFDEAVQRVEDTMAPDEDPHAGIGSRFD